MKLLDFGIAAASGAERELAGTLAYMAPELLLGTPASAASDMYSVGILAFELLTGHFPLDISSSTRFLGQVLGDDSDATLAPGVADMVAMQAAASSDAVAGAARDRDQLLAQLAEFDASAEPIARVIGRLLARPIGERYNDSAQVISDLSAALGEPLLLETSATRESFLVGAEFTGREEEMGVLAAALKSALGGKGSVMMIAGESGVGKSRLTNELRTMALVRSARVVASRAASEQGNSYELWAPVVRAMCLQTPVSAEELGILRDVVPDLEPLLGQSISVPSKVSPQAARLRLNSTIQQLFTRQKTPLLVLLEDLQWADPASLELLGLLCPLMQRLPVLIMGNYRQDEASETLRSLPVQQVIALKRLGRAQIAQLSASMLGPVGRHPVLVDYLLQQTEGNVFFLIEVVRTLAEMAGQLERIEVDGLPEHLLTGGIERILGRRLQQIPDSERSLLNLVAVAGRRLDLVVLERAGGRRDFTSWLQLCANATVLEAQQGEWQFSHDKIRELVLKQLSADESRVLHRAVAEAVTAVYGTTGAHDPILAYHWDKAGVPQTALISYLRAGNSALNLHAVVAARRHFAAALAMLRQLEDSAESCRQRVDTILRWVSISQYSERFEQVMALLSEAKSLVERLRAGEHSVADDARLANIYFWEGRLHFSHGDLGSSAVSSQRSLEIAKECGDDRIRAMASGMLGQCLMAQGQLRNCWPYLVESVEWLSAHGMVDNWMRMAHFQAYVLWSLGKIDEAFELMHRTLKAVKDPTTICLGHVNIYCIHQSTFQWEDAEREAREICELAQVTQDEILIFLGLWMLAQSQAWRQRIEEANQNMLQARAILQRRKTIGILEELYWIAEADVALLAGRITESIGHARKALEQSQAAGTRGFEYMGHHRMARALVSQSPPQLDLAEEHLKKGIEICNSIEHFSHSAVLQLLVAEIFSARGDIAEALKQVEPAAPTLESFRMFSLLEQAKAMLRDLRAGYPLTSTIVKLENQR